MQVQIIKKHNEPCFINNGTMFTTIYFHSTGINFGVSRYFSSPFNSFDKHFLKNTWKKTGFLQVTQQFERIDNGMFLFAWLCIDNLQKRDNLQQCTCNFQYAITHFIRNSCKEHPVTLHFFHTNHAPHKIMLYSVSDKHGT